MIQKYLATSAAKLIAACVIALIILAFVLWLKWDDAAQPKQDARSANATAATAKETAAVVIDRAESDATVDELVAETAKQIDTLPLPEAAQAARKAICQLEEYRNAEGC